MSVVANADQKPENLAFDSDAHPPGEAFARYRELYSGGADVFAEGPVFEANVRGWRLDRVTLYDRRLRGVVHMRDADRVARDDFDHFTLTLKIAGQFEIDSGDGETGNVRRLGTGEAVLFDMRKPMRNHSVDAHIVTLGIPRDRIVTAAGDTDGLHGKILAEAQIGLLGDYVRVLIERLADFNQDMLVPATRALGSLLAVAFVGSSAAENAASAAKDQTITLVYRMIERNIADPQFGPEALVAGCGISRSTLYRLFKPYGGLNAFILRRRLEVVRGGLADPDDRRSFARISLECGFASESHCSRLFQDMFGMRPTEYRTAALATRVDPKIGRRMRAWQVDLR